MTFSFLIQKHFFAEIYLKANTGLGAKLKNEAGIALNVPSPIKIFVLVAQLWWQHGGSSLSFKAR